MSLAQSTHPVEPKNLSRVISHACKLVNRARKKSVKKTEAIERATGYLRQKELSRKDIDIAYDALFDHIDCVYDYVEA